MTPSSRKAPEGAGHGRDEAREILRLCRGRDESDTGLAVQREAGPDGVREATPLAHVAPQAGRNAPAENLGRDPRGRDERMAERDRRPSHEKVRLLEVRPREVKGAAGGTRFPGRGREGNRSRLSPRASTGEKRDEAVGVERADGRDERSLGSSDRAEPPDQARVREAFHGGGRAENRRAERVRGPEAPEEALVQEVVGHVLDLGHLLEDDAALHLHVRGRERGSGGEVDKEIHGLFRPFRGHARVERNALLRRVRVAVATEPVGDPCDGGARAPGGPLEEEVLEEVRRAALERLLGGRAARHRDREREASHVAHRVQPHRRPVREPPHEHG